MDQKRFLTADEVFQQFGVDLSMLQDLVESGQVQALKDLGTYKYRSEDFAKLVKAGKLTARTAGELFQVDDKGDMPFLKLRKEDDGLKFGEDVEFLELDEEALNEHAVKAGPPAKTPVVPDKWFDDDVENSTSGEIPVGKSNSTDFGEVTDLDLNTKSGTPASDSDVRLMPDDDMIDLDHPDFLRSGSDSDVQLEGPISSSRPSAKKPAKKSGSDSDVRLARSASSGPKTDSDVTIVSDANVSTAGIGMKADSDSDVSLASPAPKKPESDSDVQLSQTPASQAAAPIASAPASLTPGAKDSDSDVVLVGLPDDPPRRAAPPPPVDKVGGDSDIRLTSASDDADLFQSVLAAAPDSDLNLADDGIQLEEDAEVADAPKFEDSKRDSRMEKTELDFSMTDDVPVPVHDLDATIITDDLEKTEVAGAYMPPAEENGIELEEDSIELEEDDIEVEEMHGIEIEEDGDSGITLESSSHEMDIEIDPTESDSDVKLTASKTDSDISLDSGISLEKSNLDEESAIEIVLEDSGISLDDSDADSGISLESEKDSGISLESEDDDVDFAFDRMQDDSDIRLEPMDAGSGISLEQGGADSGISIEQTDSGIRFESAGDSGISLIETDSGISLDDEDLNATFVDADSADFEMAAHDGSKTADLNLPDDSVLDSGFDVSLAEGANTIEMDFDDDDEGTVGDTIVSKGKSGKKKSDKKSMALSEAFQLDEPIEVEELDISDDLDAAGDEEFVSIDEDVLEASDEHFGSSAVSIAEDVEEEESKAEVVTPKARTRPYEPSWGLAAVVPIICASVVMAATTTVLLGGVATMWKGGEAPGPAGALISILAGLSPF